MGDWAHVGSNTHKVFDDPLKVEVKVELKETPSNYKDRRLANEPEIPDKIKVWRVQDSGKDYGGVVSRRYGFSDSPDTEIMAEGFNGGKEYGAIGIGRHGNFLQWGYSAPPSKMTEAGKKLFVNCICYITKFDGKKPLFYRQSSHRDNALRLAGLIKRIENKDFFENTFSAELQEKYGDDHEGLVKYYLDSYELIYREEGYVIDEDLKSLGIESNRKIETLERLISFLTDESKTQTARKLLDRYTEQDFTEPEEWQKWFEENKERIFFTDTGGYKFMVVPEGYLQY
jgi:hypothetical protein